MELEKAGDSLSEISRSFSRIADAFERFESKFSVASDALFSLAKSSELFVTELMCEVDAAVKAERRRRGS